MRDFKPNTSIAFDDDGRIVVRTFFSKAGVDRSEAMAFGLGEPNDRRHALALRLVRAIEAGAVFTAPEIKTDVNGKTFVSAGSEVIGRRMNADLKRLGF